MSTMCLDLYRAHTRKPAYVAMRRGFALPSAIFLLVVLAALGAFMLRFSSVQSTTSTQDLQGVRAYQAARAGAEWAAYQILRNPGAAFEAGCHGGTIQTLSAMPGTLAGFNVTVGCTANAFAEGPNTIWIYRVTSTATLTGSAPGQPNYVERQLQVNIER